MTKIAHIDDLRNDMVSAYEDFRNGDIKREDAQEIANLGGKIISTTKIQIAYHALRRERPSIPFIAAPVEGSTPEIAAPVAQLGNAKAA